ncbi:MAG TPA: SDR family oxidoreductase, partial [Roseiflexaceae bacterium]|nr:SDR family oxidoreductase [Roseiflexaceae bacterium]
MELKDRVVLVTGGGSGVGAAVAHALADAGALVTIAGRRAEALAATAADTAIQTRVADIADRMQAAELVAHVIAEFGRLDILVQAAGVNIPRRRLEELAPADWDYLMDVNATGAFNIIHAALPHMRRQHDGLVICISSTSGLRPSSLGGAAYSAAKSALMALTRVIGIEEGANGSRACTISPGEIDTPLLAQRPTPV